jgi:hypothetical protein
MLKVALITLVASGAAFSLAWAQAKAPAPKAAMEVPGGAVVARPLTTDIAVDGVDAFDCSCFDQTSRVDAALLGRVRVGVRHVSGGTVTGKVKLEYFNLGAGHSESLEQNVPALGSSAGAATSRVVEFPMTPKLLRKSAGLKATLTVTTTHFTDSNLGNNTKQVPITLCGPLVL